MGLKNLRQPKLLAYSKIKNCVQAFPNSDWSNLGMLTCHYMFFGMLTCNDMLACRPFRKLWNASKCFSVVNKTKI